VCVEQEEEGRAIDGQFAIEPLGRRCKGSVSASIQRLEVAMQGLGSTVLKHLVQVFAVLVYIFPTIAASRYRHPKHSAILFLNISLGWTVIGWVIALRWAFTPEKRSTTVRTS
jgi:hypothetical protein